MPSFLGLNPDAVSTLADKLHASAAELANIQHQIDGILDAVPWTHTATSRQVARWADEQVGPLRWRADVIRGGPSGFFLGGLIPLLAAYMPLARPAQHMPDPVAEGRALAERAKKVMEDGRKADPNELKEIMDELESHKDDPNYPKYAAAFFNRLGAKKTLALVRDIQGFGGVDGVRDHEKDKEYEGDVVNDLLRPLDEALAAATHSNRLQPQFKKGIAEAQDQWAAAQLVRFGVFEPQFLAGVANAIAIRLTVERSGTNGGSLPYPYSTSPISTDDWDAESKYSDPRVAVLEALGRNPAASAIVLKGAYTGDFEMRDRMGQPIGKDNATILLQARDLAGKDGLVSSVIRAASIELLDTDAKLAKEATGNLIESVAAYGAPKGVRSTLADIAIEYMGDFGASTSTGASTARPRVSSEDGNLIVPSDMLTAFVGQAMKNDEDAARVAAAAAEWVRARVAAGAVAVGASPGWAAEVGGLIGLIADANANVLIADGKAADARRDLIMDIFIAGLTVVPGTSVAARSAQVVGAVADRRVKGGNESYEAAVGDADKFLDELKLQATAQMAFAYWQTRATNGLDMPEPPPEIVDTDSGDLVSIKKMTDDRRDALRLWLKACERVSEYQHQRLVMAEGVDSQTDHFS